MGYTVTCPQCQEINSGSQLYCTKCQASLIGVPREQALTAEEVAAPAPSAPKAQGLSDTTRLLLIGVGVGVIAFGANFFISFGNVFCCGGFFVSVIAGSAAGFLTTRYTNIATRENAVRAGSMAGGIAGIFILFGQIAGGILPSLMISLLPVSGADSTQLASRMFNAVFESSLCFGLINLLVSAAVGSAVASKSM